MITTPTPNQLFLHKMAIERQAIRTKVALLTKLRSMNHYNQSGIVEKYNIAEKYGNITPELKREYDNLPSTIANNLLKKQDELIVRNDNIFEQLSKMGSQPNFSIYPQSRADSALGHDEYIRPSSNTGTFYDARDGNPLDAEDAKHIDQAEKDGFIPKRRIRIPKAVKQFYTKEFLKFINIEPKLKSLFVNTNVDELEINSTYLSDIVRNDELSTDEKLDVLHRALTEMN